MRDLAYIKGQLKSRAAELGAGGTLSDILLDLLSYYGYVNELEYSKIVREGVFSTASENGRIMLTAGFMRSYFRGNLDIVYLSIASNIGDKSFMSGDYVFGYGKYSFYCVDTVTITRNPQVLPFKVSLSSNSVNVTIPEGSEYVDIISDYNWSNEVGVNGATLFTKYSEYVDSTTDKCFIQTLPDYDLRVFSNKSNLIISGYEYYKLTEEDNINLQSISVQGYNIKYLYSISSESRPSPSVTAYSITNDIVFRSNADLLQELYDMGIVNAKLAVNPNTLKPTVYYIHPSLTPSQVSSYIEDSTPYFINQGALNKYVVDIAAMTVTITTGNNPPVVKILHVVNLENKLDENTYVDTSGNFFTYSTSNNITDTGCIYVSKSNLYTNGRVYSLKLSGNKYSTSNTQSGIDIIKATGIRAEFRGTNLDLLSDYIINQVGLDISIENLLIKASEAGTTFTIVSLTSNGDSLIVGGKLTLKINEYIQEIVQL